MKKIMFLTMFATFGLISFSGCDGGGGNKRVNPPVIEDEVIINTNMLPVNEFTYSLSIPPTVLILGEIPFSVGASKNGSSLSLVHSDITWTGTGAFLILNNTLGTMIVKVTYLDGTIDEMSKTVTIHVVA